MQAEFWTEETIARLRGLWSEGHSTAEIGRRMGVTKNVIIGKSHRIDLPPRPNPVVGARPFTPDEDAIIIAGADDGLDDRQIAELLVDRSDISTRNRRHRLGIELTDETLLRLRMAGSLANSARAAANRRANHKPKRAYRKKSQPVIHLPKPSAKPGWDFSGPKAPTPPIQLKRGFDLHCETVSNDERQPDGCRWLVNDRAPWRACAAKRLSGESYCVVHSARSAYYPKEKAA